ncbi:MAG: glycoside hydrolase family 3 C-terminal domain-containing protein [Clostridia bacterium]|nr:glycoside hydrolase family 3 C-terminal domain-containing protein [Clostridia bacterium]
MSSRIEKLLRQMTLEEKIAQTDMIRGVTLATRAHPAHFCSVDPESDFDWDRVRAAFSDRGIGFVHDVYCVPRVLNRLQHYFVDETRLGIPCIYTGEALHGLSFPGATSFPMPIALGASFDPTLTRKVGRAIGSETRALGIHEILAPNLDVARDPRWGRMEETFGEDTFLSRENARAIISGEQGERADREDTIICEPKHYFAHGFPESGLNCASARCGQREARSQYLPVFEAGVREAGAWNAMVAYNNIDGIPLVFSRYWMTDVLKGELGLRGYIRSDFGAVNRLIYAHHVCRTPREAIRLAFNAGLDVTGFDFSNEVWQETMKDLVLSGEISEERLDDAVRRILTVKEALGLFDHPFTDENRYTSVVRSKEHLDICLEAARESMTLLKNTGALPLKKVRTLALIGPSSNAQRLGSYSSVPYGYTVRSLADELREALPNTEILQEDGCSISPMDARMVPDTWIPGGVRLAFYPDGSFSGKAVGEDTATHIQFNWGLAKPHPDLPFNGYGVRMTFTLCPDDTFSGSLSLPAWDTCRLYADGELLLDGAGEHTRRPLVAPFDFEKGKKTAIVIDFVCDRGGRQVAFNYSRAGGDSMEKALRAAQKADAVILVCGDDTITSGEGMDRRDLILYGEQRELIRRVGALGKPKILVLDVGKSVDLTQEAPLMDAILVAFFGGERGAKAICEALLGSLSPSGHLPVTFPHTVGELPFYYSQLPGGSADYLEGHREPHWPFGFGLSYTTFALTDFTASPAGDTSCVIAFTVTNTGDRPGTAVPQVYVEDPVSSVVTPDRRLAFFTRVPLEAGASTRITHTLSAEAFRLMDEQCRWRVEGGEFVLHLGQHCQDDAQSVSVTLRGDTFTERENV